MKYCSSCETSCQQHPSTFLKPFQFLQASGEKNLREEPKNNIQSSKINETSEPSQTLPESICPVNRNTYQTLLPSFEKGKSTFNSNDQ